MSSTIYDSGKNNISQKMQVKRLLFATLVLALFFAVLSWASSLEACQNHGSTSIGKQHDIASLLSDANMNTLNKSICDLPQKFTEEIINFENIKYSNLYISENQNIISFISSNSTEKTSKLIKEELKSKGWIATVSDNENVMTFSKADGTYRWMCYSIYKSDENSVVVITLDN